MEAVASLPVCLLLCLCVVTYTSCHLCLLSPLQRGSISGLNKPGSDDCFLIKPPCGDRPADKSITTLRAGDNYTVIFQKNLDHWTADTPGNFMINIACEESGKFKTLATIPDKGPKQGEPSLHIYEVEVTIPSDFRMGKPMVIQTIYTTKNPAAPKAFYQCSDVMIK